MNKNFHRVIFNAARRMRMVVQETARSVGKSTCTSTRMSSPRSTAVEILVLIASLTAISAAAQIAADRSAPANQRATVLVAPNGVPLVNIRAPSAAGVSRNTYRQFDVDGNGAILNNSRTDVQTQLGGYVQGNPWLARGSARVIVNEVNSSNPSYLRGFVEVAGPRADVIIANPSGIFVNGSGFINASRATLTTGVPQFGPSGDLEGYIVRGGTVSVLGAGLDARTTDSLAILARAFELSGALHATELKVVAGANQVSTDLTGITPIDGTGNAPTYAIDVAQLGGMYANHIALIVNEHGVGARNAGTIQTSTGSYALGGAGKLTLSVDGVLENSGLIQTSSDATIHGAILANSGTVQSAASLTIATQGDLANHIAGAGGTLEGQRVELSSTAGDIDNRAGTIRQTSAAALTLTGPNLSNTNAGFIGAEPVAVSTGGNTGTGAGTGGSTTSPVVSPGTLTAAGSILNDGGKVYAGDIALQTPNIHNDGGTISVANLAVSGPSLSNAGGTLTVKNTFAANVGTLTNAGGRLHAGNIDITTTGDLNNQGGTLAGDGTVNLNVAGSLNNTLGSIQSAGSSAFLTIANQLLNDKGSIGAGTDLSVQASSIANTGTLRAERDSTVTVANTFSSDGSVTSGRNTTVSAGSLTSSPNGVLGAGIKADGTLGSTGDLKVTTAGSLQAAGTVLAAGNIAARGAGTDLSGSNTSGANIALTATSGDVTARHAKVTTPGTLRITANSLSGQALVNDAGVLSAGQLDLHASNIQNTQAGQIMQTGTGSTAIAVTGTLDNSGGTLASNSQDLTLTAATLLNTGGAFQHAGSGTLAVSAMTFSGANGSIVGNGALTVQADSFNQDGGRTTAKQLTIDADSFSNVAGALTQTGAGTSRIATIGTLDNTAGHIASNGQDVTLAAATLLNAGGTLQHAGTGTLNIGASQTFSGAKSKIASNGALNVHGGDFDLDGGTTSAAQISVNTGSLSNKAGSIVQTGTGTTRIATVRDFVNDGGTIVTNAVDVELAVGGTLSNADGHLQHAGTGSLRVDAASFAGAKGELVSNGALVAIAAGSFGQDGGTTTAKQITIDAGSLSNAAGVITQTGTGTTRIATTGTLDNTAGRIASNGHDLTLAAATLLNTAGTLQHAGTGTLDISAAQAFSGAKGQIASNGVLNAHGGNFDLDGGTTSAAQISVNTGSLSNKAGSIVQTGTVTTRIATARDFVNDGGTIATNATDVELAAGGTLSNADGHLQHAGTGAMNLTAGNYAGAQGELVTNGALVANVAGAFDQSGGTTTAKQITIDAGSIGNAAGVITQTGTGTTRIATTGTLDNTAGRIASNGQDLTLAAATLLNTAGTLQHAGTGTLDIGASQTFSGAKGQIASNGALNAHGGAFDLDGGTTSASQVTVDTASLSNRAGQIVHTGTGTTRIATVGNIVNDGGTIATNGTDVSLAAGGTLSNIGGHLQHAGTGAMNLTAGNYAGARGEIVSNGALRANVAGAFDQSAGTTSAKQVAIDAGSLGNVGGTLIQTGTAATHISTKGDLNNDGGTIATNAVDVEFTAGGTLSNAAGKLQHAGTGKLNLAAGAYSGAKGELVTNGALVASVAGAFGQDGGSTSASQVTIDAGSLSNVAGDIAQTGSGATRISTTGTLDNTAGRIGSNGSDVTLAAATLQNTGGTLQHAGTGALNIAATDIGNKAGQIVQTGTGVTRIAATGALTNDGGTIASNGADLNLSAGGTLSNANGHLQHAGTGALNLAAGSYSGASGEITTNNALVANVAGAFDQDGGSTSARQLTLRASSLSNRGGEIVQTGTAAATVAVARVLDNSGGAIASNGNLTIFSESLVNRGGSVRSAGTASLDLITTGLLDNSASGAIGAGGNAVLRASSFMNDAGSVTAAGELTATVSGAASNVGGTLAANGNTTVSAATLDNTRGTIAAVFGNLAVTTSGATVNTAGTLQAAGSTSLVNDSLVNTQGKATGKALTVNTNGGALDNTLGTLGATTTVDLQTGVLNNDRGLVQSGGTLTVNAGAVDNSAGFIGAAGAITASTGSFANTAGGVVLGKADVTVTTNGAIYDNRGGKTLALGNLTIDVGNGAIQNSGALIRSAGTTTLTASTVDNSATLGTDQGIDQGIEGKNITITAATLNNDGGALRADANATTTSAGTVSNTNGLISAGDTLAILDPNRASPSAKRLAVINTGGTLAAGKSLQLDAATFSADGTLTSGQDLSIAMTQDLVNNATVSANRNLTYATTGTLTNNGKLLAGNVLTVSGSDVENTASGEMRGDTTLVNASGTLTNRGLIDGRDTQVDAGAVSNIGTGRIYGDHLSIDAGTVDNLAETVNGATKAGTLSARERLDIGAQTVRNRDGALVFSGGDLFIGGALDANRQATGSGDLLENKAATIEALNNVGITASTLNNLNGGVTWHMDQTTAQVVEFAPPGSSVRFKANEVFIASPTTSGWTAVPGFAPDTNDNNAGTRLLIPSPLYPLAKFAAYYAKSPASSNDSSYQMPTGIADEVVTVAVPGAWYGSADPIWAAFGITAPVRDLPADNPIRLDRDLTVGQTATQYGKPLDHPVTQAEYDEAQTYYAAHTALDQATQTFVNTVTAGTTGPGVAASTPNGFYRDYSIWMYTATTDSPVLATSAPAKIVSGGDMTLTVGSGAGSTNDMSQILAGRTLTVTGGTIANKSQEVQATTTVSGSALTTEVRNHTFSSSKRRYDSAVFDLVIPPKTVTLAAARQEGNQNATSGKKPDASTFTATGAGTSAAGAVDAGHRVNPVVEVPSAVGGSPGVAGASASVANAGNGSGVTGGSAGGASANGATSAAAAPIGTSTDMPVGAASGSSTATAVANGAAGTASGGSAMAASGAAGIAVGATATASTPVPAMTKTGSSADSPLVVRTTTPDTGIPTASLFRTIPGPASHYLVETDPAFASYRNWLSSDYLLNALSYDPATVTKRLGDGFYEQRLIREQVAQLTGYRYLEGSKDDQDQYTDLMNAGATFAKAYQLTPGIGLSAAQMAQLTSDIVWLVEQTVTLADGSTQKVLVPQVYVRVKPGDIDGSGALLSADTLIIKNQPGEGDVINSGTIAGRTMVSITADNVQNLNGRISGGSVGIEARNDLNSIGGTIDAQNAVSLKAGRDITIASTTQTAVGAKSSSTQLDRVAGVYVTNPGGTLVASAGHDVNLVGAILSNAGAGGVTSIKAVNDINLGTVKTASSQDTTWNAKNYSRSSESAEIGSSIITNGTTVLNAVNDVNIRQGTISTEETLAVLAGHDINIESGSASQSLDSASYKKSRGFLSSKSTTQQESTSQTTVVGSSLSGKDVVVSAGNDLTVSGSQLAAQDQLSLSATRDVRVQSAEETASQSSSSTQRKSGLSASVLSGVSYGKSGSAQDQSGQSATQVGSTLSGANVSIDAGRDVQVIASTVVADKNIALTAGRNIDILAATDTQRSASSSQSASTSIGLVSGIAPRQTMYGSIKGAEHGTGDSRTAVTSLLSANSGNLTLVAGLDAQYKGAGQGNITTEGADLLAKDKVTLSGNAVRLMAATSSGDSTHQAQSKSVTLGAQLTGLVGSQITRAYDMAQASKSTTDSRLKGAQELKAGYDAYKLATSGALGAGIADAAGSGTGGDPSGSAFGVSASISSSKSHQDSAERFTTQRGTNIQAGAIDITARETNIDMQGAKLQARDIALDAKRNINLVAAQNTAETQGSNSANSLGFGVTAGIGSQNGVSFQLSASSSKGKSNGSETSYDNTLVTATDSLSIKSGGDTNLIGAQVAANRVKADIGGDLNIQSLQDRTDYESKQTSGGFDMSLCVPPICYGQVVTASANYAKQSVDHNYRSATGQSGIAAGDGGFDVTVKGNTDLKGGALTSQATVDKNSFTTGSLTTSDLVNTQNTNASSESLSVSYGSNWSSAAANAARSVTNTALSNLNSGKGLPADKNQTSQTLSVISPANVKITGTGDAMTDAKSAENVATLTSRDPATANGALINSLTLQQAQEIPKKQQEAADRQQAAQLLGSVVSNAVGDVSAQLGWAEGSPQKIALHALAGIVQAKVGDGSALAGAAAGTFNEAALPAMVDYLESQGIHRYNANGSVNANFSELLTAGSTLVGAAVGAAAGGSGSAGLGATVANNATVNNYLKHADVDKLAKKIDACGSDPSCKDKAIDEAYQVSAANDIALLNCKSTNSCDTLKAEYREGYRAIDDLVGASMKSEDVSRILNLETNAQTIIRSGLDQRQCTTQACQDNAASLVGIGKGLAKITPAGLVTGSGVAAYELTTSIINNGLTDTAATVAQGIAGLPADLKSKLNSDDPQVRGEALVDTLAIAGVATAVAAKLGQVGYATLAKQVEAKVAQAAEAEAIAKANVEGNLRRDDAQQYDHFRSPTGDGWDWQKQAPNNGAVPGTAVEKTIDVGFALDRYGSRRGEYMSPVGTSLEQRGLPPGKAADPYEQYLVQRSFNVVEEKIAPAFDQPGGGVQLRARIIEVKNRYATIDELIRFGYLKYPKGTP